MFSYVLVMFLCFSVLCFNYVLVFIGNKLGLYTNIKKVIIKECLYLSVFIYV